MRRKIMVFGRVTPEMKKALVLALKSWAIRWP